MALFTVPRFIPDNYGERTQDSVSYTYKSNLSSADIASLKSTIENLYNGVGFTYSGAEYDYDVQVQGPGALYQKAINYLFPGGHAGIIVNTP